MVTPTIATCPSCSTKNRLRRSDRDVPRCSACQTILPWIIPSSADRFDDEIAASVPVLVDMWAPWCSPCATISPIVEQMGHDYAGRLKVVKLEIDRAYDVAKRFRVESIPLLLMLKDGHEVDRLTGAVQEDALREVVERHIAAPAGDGSR
jgi:thioredoxin 2